MNEWSLAFARHARVLCPLVAVIVTVSVVRLLWDTLIVQQLHGIATMLLSVAMTVYAFDAIVRLIGIADDRLALMSPRTRWQVGLIDSIVLSGLLATGYIAHTIPAFANADIPGGVHLREFGAYLVSVLAGFGLVTALVYAFKAIRSRGTFRASVWATTLLIQTALIGVTVTAITSVFGVGQWALGVSGETGTANVFAGFVPVTVFGSDARADELTIAALINAVLALSLWLTAWAISRRRNNFVEL